MHLAVRQVFTAMTTVALFSVFALFLSFLGRRKSRKNQGMGASIANYRITQSSNARNSVNISYSWLYATYKLTVKA